MEELKERRKPGKKPYPEERKRVLRSVRLAPATLKRLAAIDAANLGRAIDRAVEQLDVKEEN